ncbi:hypothetical protein QUB13_12435 [Microcoleus sp. B4-D4]
MFPDTTLAVGRFNAIAVRSRGEVCPMPCLANPSASLRPMPCLANAQSRIVPHTRAQKDYKSIAAGQV